MKYKYLKNKSVVEWLCSHKFTVLGTSHIWNGFIKELSWITSCLGWKVGDGKSIKVGSDPAVGSCSDYSLPDDLISYLGDYGITYLSDV